MISQILAGGGFLLRGFRLMAQPGVRRYVVMPLLINFLLFSLFIALGLTEISTLLAWLLGNLPDWLQWLEWLLWPLFLLAFLLIGFYLTLLLAGLVAAPFNGLLAEAVERHLGHEESPASGWREFLATLLPSLLSELRKLGYFLLRALPLWLLFLIPGLNLAAPLLWLLFSAWMLALEYLDYPLSNHGRLFPRYHGALRQRRWLALGFGGAVLLLTLVPLLNFIVMPAAVAGATALAVKENLLQKEEKGN